MKITDIKLRIFSLIALFAVIYLNFVVKIQYGMNAALIVLFLIVIFAPFGKEFFKDWAPPISLFYFYEVLRAHSYQINLKFQLNHLQIFGPLNLERKLFFFLDKIPTQILQENFYISLDNPRYGDYICFVIYNLFFSIWIIVALLFWFNRRKFYFRYVYGLAAFSLAACLMYVFLPTAPPWYLYDLGLLDNAERILWGFHYFGNQDYRSINEVGQNLFAAIPSLHAGWTFYAGLYLTKAYGKRGLIGIAISLAIAAITWYGAEHYVVDSLVGIAMAILFYKLSLVNYTSLFARFKKIYNSKVKKAQIKA